MKQQTVYVIGDLVAEFYDSLQFTAQSLVDNGDNTYTLNTTDTLYLQECFKFDVLGTIYEVMEVKQCESITLKGNIAPPLTFKPYQIHYFFGKIRETNTEMQLSQNDVSERTPFVYLLEKLKDKFFDESSSIERETPIRLFFLTQSNYSDWKQSDHHEKAVIPMRNLLYKFIDFINNSKKIGNFEQYEVEDCVNFGIYKTDKGNEQLYFNDFLSGCMLEITLPILKSLNCKCK